MSQTHTKIKQQIIVGIVGVYLCVIAWRLAAPFISNHLTAESLELVNILVVLSYTTVPVAIMFISKDKLSDYGFTADHLTGQIGCGIAIGLSMACVLTLMPMLLGWNVYTRERYSGIGYAVYKLFYYIAIIGLSEEFVFRGFLYSKLNRICLSDTTPIVISSVLFGMLHFSGLNFVQVLISSLIGAFFCVCKERVPHCSVLSLAIAHGIHDWLIRVISSLM